MSHLDYLHIEPHPITFGYTARTKVKVVVNRKRKFVRVPELLHRMSIKTQRNWCNRNFVDFNLTCRQLKASIKSKNAA